MDAYIGSFTSTAYTSRVRDLTPQELTVLIETAQSTFADPASGSVVSVSERAQGGDRFEQTVASVFSVKYGENLLLYFQRGRRAQASG